MLTEGKHRSGAHVADNFLKTFKKIIEGIILHCSATIPSGRLTSEVGLVV